MNLVQGNFPSFYLFFFLSIFLFFFNSIYSDIFRKTEVFNQVISYFCTLSSLNRDEHLLEKKISMIPVILEFFGHRQKFQNYNSSRFAKILKLKIKVEFSFLLSLFS